MMAESIFPTLLIALNVCAAMPYAWHGNWRMMVYWLPAATPNASVTYTGAAKSLCDTRVRTAISIIASAP